LTANPTFVHTEILEMQSKHFFLLCLLVPAFSAHSQFKKGTKMIGADIGSAMFSSGKTDYSYPNATSGYTANNRNWNLSLSPSIGWFIQDNCVVGGSISLSSSGQKVWIETTTGNTYKEDNNHNTDYGLGIFSRYYFSTANSIRPFAHVFINAGSGVTKTDGFYYATNFTQTYEGKSSDRFFYNAGLNAGITKMINSTIGIDAFVGYLHSYSKLTTTTIVTTNDNGTITKPQFEPTQQFNGNGVNIGVGIQVFLSK
jgi:hypothetical protein